MDNFQYIVVGGGIVGLATANALQQVDKNAKVLLVEKEHTLATHQTGHNSGVIHSGIYYQPGSLKAKLCLEGASWTKAFCEESGIPFETCGKLLVATNDHELSKMDDLAERAKVNGIAIEKLTANALQRIEPRIAGRGALLVPSTGIVDYKKVSTALAARFTARGGTIVSGAAVTAISEAETSVKVATTQGAFSAGKLVVCAGLQSDRLCEMSGLKISHRIIPFRGEYYRLPREKAGIIHHLIYPIPDPELPFLGIHLTRMIDGTFKVGPNAVLGFAREGYEKGSIELGDVADMLKFPGFWKLIWRYRNHGAHEMAGSIFKSRYLRACQKYCPELTIKDLAEPIAGIRAQAVLINGSLVQDFLFVSSDRMLHVCNAPSPAATSAMPIGEMIVKQLMQAQT